MNIAEMSIAYKLQSNDFQVFYDKNNYCFVVSKNICLDCNSPWSHRINQCIFCGTRNYFVWICSNNKCGDLQPLTISKKPENCLKCNKRNSYFKSCFNNQCPTNTNKKLFSIILSLKRSKSGSFESESPFKISQNFCNQCSSENNIMKSKEFVVRTILNEDSFLEKDYIDLKNNFDVVIIFSEKTNKYLTITKDIKIKKFENDIDISIFS